MAITLSDLQAQRDLLMWMFMRGVLKVTIDGMTTEFANEEGLLKRRAYVDSEIAKLTPGSAPTYTLGQFSKDGRGNNQHG